MTAFFSGRECRVFRFHTAWGRCCLTYAPQPFALLNITLPGIKDTVPEKPTDASTAAHPSAIQVGQAITAFFSGHQPAEIDESWLSTESLTPKEWAVLKVVRGIPYGATRTYAEVAETAGFSNGARFAGNALHKNPFPIIIPCHRVVRSDGAIGGFAAGCEIKKKMIALEATHFKRVQGIG